MVFAPGFHEVIQPVQIQRNDPIGGASDEPVQALAGLADPGVKLRIPDRGTQVIGHPTQKLDALVPEGVHCFSRDVQKPDALSLDDNRCVHDGPEALRLQDPASGMGVPA